MATTTAQENGKIPTGDPSAVSAEPKFTPGPWVVATSNSWRRIVSMHRGMTNVCEPITQNDGHPDLHFRNGGYDGPDAHLIAAAPSMYAALENTVNNFPKFNRDAFPNIAAMLDQCRAALAKARGQS